MRSARMLLTEGFMRRLFGVFERHKTSVDVVATSEVSVSVTIDDASRLDALMVDLREHGDVTVERNRGIVSVVGTGLADGGKAMACALTAIGDIQVHMLSLSASGINLTVVVDGEQVIPAMQRSRTWVPCRRRARSREEGLRGDHASNASGRAGGDRLHDARCGAG